MITGAMILAVFKAFPALWNIYQESVDLYIKESNARDESNVNDIQEKRDGLLAALKAPGLTNEDRSRIRRVLYTLHSR